MRFFVGSFLRSKVNSELLKILEEVLVISRDLSCKIFNGQMSHLRAKIEIIV